MREFFAEGGFWMYPILVVGLAGAVLGAMALGTRSRGLALAAMGCAAFALLLGLGGMMHGRSQTERALAMVAPSEVELIRQAGYRESNRPLQLGGGFMLFGLALGAVGFALSKPQ